jgi:hypothetical protein
MITFPAVLIFSCVCTAFAAYERLSAENAAVLLVDHQTGLAQLARVVLLMHPRTVAA